MGTTKNGNDYNKAYRITCGHKELKDAYLKITVNADNQTQTFYDSILFQTMSVNQIKQDEKTINNKINAIWKKVQEKIFEHRNFIYERICDKAYIIDGTDQETIRALKIFFGQKYYEYIKNHKNTKAENHNDIDIFNYVFGKLKDGVLKSGTKGEITLNGITYNISVLSLANHGSAGSYRVLVNKKQKDNDSSAIYIVTSSYNAVKYEMDNYMDQLEGMFDDALDEVWAETWSDIGTTFYGLDNLNKIAVAWVDESLWGTKITNNLIEISFKGLHKDHSELTKLCESTQNAIKAISDAKNNPSKEKLEYAFACVDELENIFGGWESILQ